MAGLKGPVKQTVNVKCAPILELNASSANCPIFGAILLAIFHGPV